jgi:sugar phosphate isomerase/epimerase
MDLGLFTDSVPELPFASALDLAVEIGARAVEVAAGGMSPAPHLDLGLLLRDRQARERWSATIADRGLRLAALNCSAWLLHPVRGDASRTVVEQTMQLAGLLSVRKIVTMSGLPGDGPGASTTNWSWSTWPPDAVALRERQWDMALGLWSGLADRARAEGVTRIALELHPWQLVFNVPTLRRLRDAIGVEIGANLDPSHLFWQQMDPAAVIGELGEAVHHVHIKDTALNPGRVALNGVLDHTAEPSERAWTFRAAGLGHDAGEWSRILDALARVGYDDLLSIENEDPFLGSEEGVRAAASFVRERLSERSITAPR